jgi:hypothetical protein
MQNEKKKSLPIPTVEQFVLQLRKEEKYEENQNLYPKLIELALARHMAKENKDECEPNKCLNYQEEIKLVISELQVILKKEESERNTL